MDLDVDLVNLLFNDFPYGLWYTPLAVFASLRGGSSCCYKVWLTKRMLLFLYIHFSCFSYFLLTFSRGTILTQLLQKYQ